jgi:hypothetical protein
MRRGLRREDFAPDMVAKTIVRSEQVQGKRIQKHLPHSQQAFHAYVYSNS